MKIYNYPGLSYNALGNNTQTMRYFARTFDLTDTNTTWEVLRLTVSSGNPFMNFSNWLDVSAHTYQTNVNFRYGVWQKNFCSYMDTSGNNGESWNIEANNGNNVWLDINHDWGYATRIQRVTLTSHAGYGALRVTLGFRLYCNRWDYLTVS
jgi:hypothetical protein